jgi:hypothetical protein
VPPAPTHRRVSAGGHPNFNLDFNFEFPLPPFACSPTCSHAGSDCSVETETETDGGSVMSVTDPDELRGWTCVGEVPMLDDADMRALAAMLDFPEFTGACWEGWVMVMVVVVMERVVVMRRGRRMR